MFRSWKISSPAPVTRGFQSLPQLSSLRTHYFHQKSYFTSKVDSQKKKKNISPVLTRSWPARTPQGYKCKQCTSLGRGNFCELHKESKNIPMKEESTPNQPKPSKISMLRNPSLTLATICIIQQVMDSPIAQ